MGYTLDQVFANIKMGQVMKDASILM